MAVRHYPLAWQALKCTPSECEISCCSVDPFSKKDWYDIKAPSAFTVRNVGKTLVTRTAGTKVGLWKQQRPHAAAPSCCMSHLCTVSFADTQQRIADLGVI